MRFVALATDYDNTLAPAFLRQINTALVTGVHPDKTLAAFADVLGQRPPSLHDVSLERGQLLVWHPALNASPDSANEVDIVTVEPGAAVTIASMRRAC